MVATLSFFPPSLPDETLPSRIVRYHLLSCNGGEMQTFRDLFDSAPFALDQIVPTKLDTLAARLANDDGDPRSELINANTLLPLFRPFPGGNDSRAHSPEKPGDGQTVKPARLPRRVVGMHGTARLCLRCVIEDDHEFGVPYWHRAHQIPGVTACWKHETLLVSSCPICRCPFSFKSRVLRLPWSPCRCGWQPLERQAVDQQAAPLAVQFAVFARVLMQASLGVKPRYALMLCRALARILAQPVW